MPYSSVGINAGIGVVERCAQRCNHNDPRRWILVWATRWRMFSLAPRGRGFDLHLEAIKGDTDVT